jgi:anti-sigma factor RsiW
MVLNCKHVWDCISAYLDDALPEEMRDRVQRHLDHCEICSAILDSARNILCKNIFSGVGWAVVSQRFL